MEDRYLMQQNLPQIYGTQGRMVGDLYILFLEVEQFFYCRKDR